MSEWPQLDPITGRMICQSCFNGIHYHELHHRRNHLGNMESYWITVPALKGKAEHACDGECDCVHRSEETWAAIEQKNKREAKRLRKQAEKEALEQSPLRVI